MISVAHQHPCRRFSAATTVRVVKVVQRTEGRNFRSISIVFTTSVFIRCINKKFLKHDYATDIITFRMGKQTPEAELYVNLDMAASQAHAYGVTYSQEVCRLIVHGMLHLCGFNDGTKAQRASMRKRENTYLQRLEGLKR